MIELVEALNDSKSTVTIRYWAHDSMRSLPTMTRGSVSVVRTGPSREPSFSAETTRHPIRDPAPITYFGSAWVTLGLVRSVPPPLELAARQQRAFESLDVSRAVEP
jgi:hypothetical protein